MKELVCVAFGIDARVSTLRSRRRDRPVWTVGTPGPRPATAIAAPVRQASQAVRSCVKGNERTCRWMRNHRNRNSRNNNSTDPKTCCSPRQTTGRWRPRRPEASRNTRCSGSRHSTNRRRFLRMGPRLRESLASPKESSGSASRSGPSKTWAVPSAIPSARGKWNNRRTRSCT